MLLSIKSPTSLADFFSCHGLRARTAILYGNHQGISGETCRRDFRRCRWNLSGVLIAVGIVDGLGSRDIFVQDFRATGGTGGRDTRSQVGLHVDPVRCLTITTIVPTAELVPEIPTRVVVVLKAALGALP